MGGYKNHKESKEALADQIKIDYENIDSEEIMREIKEEISKQNRSFSYKASRGYKYEKRNTMKSLLKTILIRLVRPFRPVVRILIHEFYQDLIMESKQRVDRLEKEYGEDRKKEYIKLLYGLSHNIVVELTKLKIEADDLRVKVSILEKDFENYKKRERALEKHILE